MRIRSAGNVAFVLIMVLASGCAERSAPRSSEPSEPRAPAAAAAPAELAKPDAEPPASPPEPVDHAALAKEILGATGVRGGLVVHVGCGAGELTQLLRAGDSYLVHGIDRDAAKVSQARKRVREAGLHGPVSFDQWSSAPRLPYIDDLARLIVVSGGADVAQTELLRVLAPRGVAYVQNRGLWAKTVKPAYEDTDEWTHYLHDATNNAVAEDTRVGPPRHMQWLGGPLWTRNHHKLNSVSSVVTASGRIFYIVDEATSANMSAPGKWALIARDAASGVMLWRKPMESWTSHTQGFRRGPPQVTRLLVTSGDRVYAPLALSAPVSAMDAATGETLQTFEDTAGAEEIVLAEGVMLVLTGAPVAEHAAGHVLFKGKAKLPNRKKVVAVDPRTGAKLWECASEGRDIRPETLASDGARAYFKVDETVKCLDLKSGAERWTFGERGKPQARKKIAFGTHVLVVSDGVVLSKVGSNLVALSADDGAKLWETRGGAGFHAPMDIFVIDGLVWLGDHPRDSVAPPPVNDFSAPRDLRTGEVKAENRIMVDLQTSGHHHRCYREKATSRYIISGKRGIEMMDIKGDEHARNNWVRGTCQYGMLPANGLVYAPPHSCGCYMESLLKGFWALAPTQPIAEGARRGAADAGRLVKGPAYGTARNAAVVGAESWPQYRHDALRSGVAGTTLPGKLARRWTAEIGGRLTQPVVAGGKVLVAAADEGVVHALDCASGKAAWDYVAGGRVDSPPAVHEGLVLFGSADGRVHCLRLSDGELVWRFLAAPADLRTVAMDRVESVWPVHGSVLVQGGVAYCSAGRSTWIDGGIDLYGLDPATGRVVHRTTLVSRHPKLKEGEDGAKKEHVSKRSQNTTDYKTFLQPDLSDSFSMAGGSVSDVLVSDGTNVYLHQVKFGADLERRPELSRHLLSTSSLLDGTENHRSHWVLGTGDFSRVPVAYSWITNRGGWGGRKGVGIGAPMGVMMIYDEDAAWVVKRKGGANGRYVLARVSNKPFSPTEKSLPDFRVIPQGEGVKVAWQKDIPLRTRAMLKSGDKLYIAGMPVAIPKDDPHAAYEGRLGGTLWVVSAEDGTRTAEHKLASPVVWDGMAAADGALFASMLGGKVECWSGE